MALSCWWWGSATRCDPGEASSRTGERGTCRGAASKICQSATNWVHKPCYLLTLLRIRSKHSLPLFSAETNWIGVCAHQSLVQVGNETCEANTSHVFPGLHNKLWPVGQQLVRIFFSFFEDFFVLKATNTEDYKYWRLRNEDKGMRNEDPDGIKLSSVLNLQSSILNPYSTILNQRSSIINPPSYILNPHSTVLNPQSSVLNPQSSILGPQPSIYGPQSSIFNHQSSILMLQS